MSIALLSACRAQRPLAAFGPEAVVAGLTPT
jgi:hypothetical protein